MKRAEAWQLTIAAFVTLVAFFLVLNIDHPDWVGSVLLWQPVGQRGIVLQYGQDLGSSLQIVLAADVGQGGEPDAESMEATRRVIEGRVGNLVQTVSVVQVLGTRRIVVELPDTPQARAMTGTLQARGLVEFVDVGHGSPMSLAGEKVQTTLDFPPTPEAAEMPQSVPITPTVAATATVPTTPTAALPAVFETVLTSDDVVFMLPGRGRTTGADYEIAFRLTEEATDRFVAYAATHAGRFVCIALDKEIIAGASLPSSLNARDAQGRPSILNVPAFNLTDEDAARAAVLFAYGPLPVPLTVEELTSLGPTLGQATVQRLGRAVGIGVLCVLLLMALLYRLPGVLADLALVAFGLFSLAACKAVPLPVTLPTVAGFSTAAFIVVLGHVTICERLRDGLRAGQSPSRVIRGAFSQAWPSVRDAHLVCVVLSTIVWVAGVSYAVEAVHWFGVALFGGTLSSLFATMLVSRSLLHLVFGRLQGVQDERGWLLGI